MTNISDCCGKDVSKITFHSEEPKTKPDAGSAIRSVSWNAAGQDIWTVKDISASSLTSTPKTADLSSNAESPLNHVIVKDSIFAKGYGDQNLY